MQEAHRSLSTRAFLRILTIAGVILLLPACAAVNQLDTQPFQDYQSAISTLKDQSDQALQAVYQAELDQFKAKILAGDKALVPQLLLNFPPDQDFVWAYPAPSDPATQPARPLFASVADMRQTMAAMNTQLLNYAGLLLALSGADDSTQFNPADEAQEFDSAASSLLGQLNGLGVNTSGVTSKDLALFSTIAANLAKAYLENKRSELLTEILNEGLGPLQKFVDQAQQAMLITSVNAENEYMNQRQSLARNIIQNNDSTSLDSLLSLNDQITQQLELYKNIYNGYGALPSSQLQLIAAIKSNQQVDLAELINYAANIKQQYETLKASNPSPAE